MAKLVLFVLGLCALARLGSSKISCFDEKKDLEGVWTWYPPSAPVKYASNRDALPGTVGKLNLPGTGLWYLEGTGTGQEYKLTLPEKVKPYQTRSTKVQVHVTYYDKNPRRGTIEPVKSLLPLEQLPVTTGNTWSTATFDIDPRSDTPLELSFFLSRGHFVVIDKVVLAVDEAVPKDVTAFCAAQQTTTTKPATATSKPGGATASAVTPAPAPTSGLNGRITADGSCQTYALPECQCNCACNCAKC